jgi:hypothetical protein
MNAMKCEVCNKILSKKKYKRCRTHAITARFSGHKHTEASKEKTRQNMLAKNRSKDERWLQATRDAAKKRIIRSRNCKICGDSISPKGEKGSGLCRSCSRTGGKNPAYKKGHTKKRPCKICGKEIRGFVPTEMCRLCFLRDPERRKRVSQSHRILVASGKHPSGDGTKTPLQKIIRGSFEMRVWVLAVFSRDGYCCINCGEHNDKITADHIKPFALVLKENNIKSLNEALECKELWNINNGRTLCRPCHKLTPTWGFRTREMMRNRE